MVEIVDSPKGVRAGEELSKESLASYLAKSLPSGASGELHIEQFPSGHSNLTYLVTVGSDEYVLRRPPFGSKVKSAHDMGREYRVLSKLHAVYPLAPEPVLYCEDETVIGAKFYLMRRFRGAIVRRHLPSELGLGPEKLRILDLGLVDNLARIHAVDYVQAGLADLGKPEGYVERQVNGWTKRYEDSRTDDIPLVLEIAAWLAKHRPPDSGATLIHNDYKLDNLVLDAQDPTRIIGVLDWEMATIGDPLMDLGTSISYWTEVGDSDEIKMMSVGPTHEAGSITRAEFVKRYEEKSGREVKNPLFYFVFGCYKTLVVMQQLYYRYKQGLTKDERFAAIPFGMQIMGQHTQKRLEAGSV